MLDDHFDMDAQIKNICRSAHFHQWNIGAIHPLLTDSAAAQLVHSLVTSQLDYHNSLLNGVPGYRIRPLILTLGRFDLGRFDLGCFDFGTF